MAMIKKLSRQGNSAALIIDRPLMQLMGIDCDTPLKLTLNGRSLTIEPLTDEERAKKFTSIVQKSGQRYANAFRKLAE